MNNGGNPHQSPQVNTKKYTTTTINKNRGQPQWWCRTTNTYCISPSKFLIGILLYVVCVQYSIIRTKDAAILTILTHPQHEPSQSLLSKSSISMSLPSRNLFSNQQYKLFETFRKKCDTTTATSIGTTTTTTTTEHGVGVFPIRKPSTDINIVRKIQQQTQKKWKPYTRTILRKVSYPIFVPSLPKSGTTSIWKYFKCGYQAACHNWIQGTVPGEKSSLLGKCMEQNIRHKLVPPFDNCGPYDVFTDSGVRKKVVYFFSDSSEHLCVFLVCCNLDCVSNISLTCAHDDYNSYLFLMLLKTSI